jgi:ABC-type dipeptide/oligopeptide/nickel transport system ATPase component
MSITKEIFTTRNKPKHSFLPHLQVKELSLYQPDNSGWNKVLDRISLNVTQGQKLGLIGRSGSGKTMLARTIIRLEAPGIIRSGQILFKNSDLVKLGEKEMNNIRGHRIAMAFQDPLAAMDPVFTMETQFQEVLSSVRRLTRSSSNNHLQQLNMAAVWDMLASVGVTSPEIQCRKYPHQWSLGMLQRAQVIMVFLPAPEIVILDEVTSSLDPTIRLQILELIRFLAWKNQTSLIFISHDLHTVAHICDTLAVMDQGCVIESGTVKEMAERPSHSLTRNIFQAAFGGNR